MIMVIQDMPVVLMLVLGFTHAIIEMLETGLGKNTIQKVKIV